MRKLFAAAILSTALTGMTARADDAPATTQPMPEKHIVVTVQTNGATDTARPAKVGTRAFKSIRTGGGPMDGNVEYRAISTARTEKGAWMGIATSHPPLALLKQLKIKSGLVVDDVKAGSPADTAGLKPQDIIQKIDDQILINPSQLEGLVRLHNPGDSVTLTILHEGAQSTLTAKLVEHDVLVMSDDGPGMINFQPGMAMPVMPAMPNLPMPGGVGKVLVTPGANAHVEVTTTGQNGQVSSFESQFSDGTNQLTIVRRDNKKILTIKDAQGKQLFEGPVDTAEEQQAIPKDLLPKFQEMQKMANMTDDSPKPGN